jgi:hypothetical protein
LDAVVIATIDFEAGTTILPIFDRHCGLTAEILKEPNVW